MSDHSKHSPSGRGIANSNISDDDFSTSSTRDKFRRERSLDGGSYVDSYDPKKNDYGRYSRGKRHLRSPSPDTDRRHKYRRTSSMSPPPPSTSSAQHHHSHRYRGSYTRPNRERERDSEGRDADHSEGDHYIPNYDRDGYTPGARYGRNTEIEQQQNQHHHYHHHHRHQRSRRRPSLVAPQHKQRHRHHQLQPQSNSQISNYGMLDNTNSSMIIGNRSPLSRMPMMDLQQLDYIIPFKLYCDYLRQTQQKGQLTDDEVQRQYDDYKEKITSKLSIKFFNNNKEKQWFLEKYHPQISQLRVDNMKQRRRHNFMTFMQGLQQGQYDGVQYDMDSSNEPSTVDKIDVDDITGDTKSLTTDNASGSAATEDYENHLVIKTVPPTISRQKIIDMCNQVDGFQYLALSEPSVAKKFHRIGWIHFSEETDMQKVFEQLDNQKVDDFVFHLAMNRKQQSTSGRQKDAPDITNTLDRLTLDLDQATQLAKKMDAELEKEGLKDVIDRAHKVIQGNNSTTTTNSDDSSTADNTNEMDPLTSTKKKLDLILTYLRLVHMYCYYCGLECDSTEELDRRCLQPHRRKLPTPDASERMNQQWLLNLDQRIGMKLNSWDDETVVICGGKSLKSETDTFLAEHVEKEHDAKYKCKVGDCAKAFKGVEFVEKHIYSKHNDEIQRIKDGAMFYNNYMCDPNHLLATSNNNNNNNSNNFGILSTSNTMMNNGSNNGVFYGGAPQFMTNISPGSMQAASVGTPWDQIPRVGFGSNVGWSTSLVGQIGGRLGGGGIRQSNSTQASSDISDMILDMPQDPREVKSYVDLDAPADGDSNISFY